MEKFQAPAHGKQSLLFNISNIVSIPLIPYRYTLSETICLFIDNRRSVGTGQENRLRSCLCILPAIGLGVFDGHVSVSFQCQSPTSKSTPYQSKSLSRRSLIFTATSTAIFASQTCNIVWQCV